MVRVNQQSKPPGPAVMPSPSEPSPPGEEYIYHPLSPGEIVEVDDIDGLIDLYEELDAVDKKVYGAKLRIREALARLTEGDQKTRRVRGKRRKAKVEMPGPSWDQSILKECWNSYPDLAPEVMSISSLRVKLREFKKVVGTSGDDAFVNFRDMVTAANRGPVGTPTVKIEE